MISIGESLRNVPFEIKRFYYINSVTDTNGIRGKHAHKKLEQVLFCLNGSVTLHLDDGRNKEKAKLETSAEGVVLEPMVWHTLTNFSKDCVILVVADDYYDESDYIRNYEDFIQQIKSAKR